MAWYDFITRKERTHSENRGVVDESFDPIYGNIAFNSYSSFSTSKSLKLSTVYRCVNLISDAIASLPLIPYSYQGGNWKYVDEANPLYNLLNVQPNNLMGAFTFKKMIVYHLLYKGDCYIRIKNEGGKKSLVLLNPDLITVAINREGDIVYNYAIDVKKVFKDEEIIHIMNFTQNGVTGESTITHASLTIGTAYDGDKNASDFFKSGSMISGILRPLAGVNISKDKAKAAKTAWYNTTSSDVVGSVSNSIIVLDSGLEYQPISISPKDAQLLESRSYSVIDIARFFGVPPSLVFSQGDKFSTAEQQSMDFLTNCLSPILEKIENEMFRKLYSQKEWINNDLRFDTEQLLRMDAVTRGTYYTSMFNIGAMTTNEVREKINGKSPLPGGNEAFIQVNLQKLSKPIVQQETPIDNKLK